jgi:hypothetical protein
MLMYNLFMMHRSGLFMNWVRQIDD